MTSIQVTSLFGPQMKKLNDTEVLLDAPGKYGKQPIAAKLPVSHLFYQCSPRETPRKGIGLFAEEKILKSAIIITERPSFVHGPLTEEQDAKFCCGPKNIRNDFAKDLLNKFMGLSQQDQSDVMVLHNCREENFQSRDWTPGEHPNRYTLVGKFVTNRFRISPNLTGIYFRCSFLNHSCEPNCDFQITGDDHPDCVERQVLTIRANQEIKVGDELTISYMPRGAPFEERQSFLLWCYGFKCACSQCAKEKAKLYPDGYDGYLFKNKQKVELERSKRVDQFAKLQGRNIVTIIKDITGEGPLFPKNGIILEENPLMLITKEELKIINTDSGQPRQDYHPMITRFLQLSAEARMEFLNLHNWRVEAPKTILLADITQDSIPSPEELMGIWEVNRFPLDDGMEGVFSIMSNLNHSCKPNCRVSWNPEQKTLNLMATKTLKVGDEITICYDQNKIYGISFEKRQQYLKKNYGFDCHCFRCMREVQWGESSPPPKGIRSIRQLSVRPYPTSSDRVTYPAYELKSFDSLEAPFEPLGYKKLDENRGSQNKNKGVLMSGDW